MPDSGLCTAPPSPPVLAEGQLIRRVILLADLQSSLSALGFDCLLVRNHRLVLRSSGGRMGPSGPTDPQLYIFTGRGTDIATTDGTSYRFASGGAHPADDPHGAAAAACHDTAPSTPGRAANGEVS